MALGPLGPIGRPRIEECTIDTVTFLHRSLPYMRCGGLRVPGRAMDIHAQTSEVITGRTSHGPLLCP